MLVLKAPRDSRLQHLYAAMIKQFNKAVIHYRHMIITLVLDVSDHIVMI